MKQQQLPFESAKEQARLERVERARRLAEATPKTEVAAATFTAAAKREAEQIARRNQ